MSQRTETICDQCGARKGETNHWWSIWQDEGVFSVFLISQGSNRKDYCSESCVMHALGEFFDAINAKRKMEAELPKEEEVYQEFLKASEGDRL